MKKFRLVFKTKADSQRGQAFIMVMIVLLLGSLIVGAGLNFMGTGVKNSVVYDSKTDELHAADSGLEDAKWQIKYENLKAAFTSPPYSAYDYSTAWNYDLADPVNGKDVNVTIKNSWIPKDLAVPTEEQAETIINSNRLMVTGGAAGGTTEKITITYFPQANEDLAVESIGVWLPRGFSYVAGSSNLEVTGRPYYSVPAISPHAGNQAIVWEFNSVPFVDFPGADIDDYPITIDITFQFDPEQTGATPDIVAWINTSGVGDISYSWSVDIKVYQINSVADGTEVESFITKAEMRTMQSAANGDYFAAGNSLMIDTNGDYNGIRDQLLSSSSSTVSAIPANANVAAAYLYWSAWLPESSKTSVFSDTCSSLDNWTPGSSWALNSNTFRGHDVSGSDPARYLTLENNLDLSSYAAGTVMVSWTQYENGTLEVDDGLDFSFSADGGTTWGGYLQAFRDDIGSSAVKYGYMIPGQYFSNSFKFRFFLRGMNGTGEYCIIDNIAVSLMPPDTSIAFSIDGQQVYFDSNGDPQIGSGAITSSKSQVLQNTDSGAFHGFSYSGFKDVTELVRTYSVKAPDPAVNYPGNAVYTVGGVTGVTGDNWSYAGWSIIIIYTSPDTLGHQLYLFDTLRYCDHSQDFDLDNDGQPGGTISGFIVPPKIASEVNAAKVTCFVGEGDEVWTGDFLSINAPESYQSHPEDIPNSYKLWDGTSSPSNSQAQPNNVWNSKSVGLAADGVDVDTFNVSWASGRINEGDTSARLDIYTETDIWNVIYLIISFRSETRIGGDLVYLIK